MFSSNNSKNVSNFIRRRKTNLRKVFHSKCCLCGFEEVQEALEFHHVNPEEKEFSISSSENQTKALEAQLQEMKKCILVCSNCHRGIHYGIYQVPENWQDFYDEDVANELRTQLHEVVTHKINYCKRCGKEIDRHAEHCVECARLLSRKCDRPSREKLKEMIRTTPFTQIADKYGVTDNAIRKWCDQYNLPRKKKDINAYSDETWKNV